MNFPMELDAPTFVYAQWLFLKFLALNYFFAFGSLFLQIKGLYGTQGILPINELLSHIKKRTGGKIPFRDAPTFFWVNSKDFTLELTAFLGMVASLLVIGGVCPAPLFFFLWAAYLSFLTVGSVFLSFQWDILLVEVGFIAIFFSLQTPPPILMIYLLWIVLFRLIFSSGVVKWISGCPEWRALKAMEYHFETQPIPNRLAFYSHILAKLFTKLFDIGVNFFEIAVPFLIFTPQPLRYVGFVLTVFFQILIMLTGNYAFFNTLTIALCIPLLDATYLQGWFAEIPTITAFEPNVYLSVALNFIAGILILWNVLELISLFYPLGRIDKLFIRLAPFRIVNSYGLFARMTTERNEIIIEGSDDGTYWKAYEFKWKPGDPKFPPRQVAPHQPRLDWQMWFAALSSYQYNPWFVRFLERLLEGSPDVLGLLKTNPFPLNPPKYIRSMFYQYHFTDLRTKRKTGMWWTRTLKGHYSPVYSIQKKDHLGGFTTLDH